MDLGVISVRYARALLKCAIMEKREDELYHEMLYLMTSYVEVPELRITIANPILSKGKKQMLLETACGNTISPLVRKFIVLILREDRENILQFIAASYITLYRKDKNITVGKLITAAAVDSVTKQKMKQMVESKTRGTVEFNTEVEPDIIGGFILEYDTYRLDASVKTILRRILTELKK